MDGCSIPQNWRLCRDRRQDLLRQEAIVSQKLFCYPVAVLAWFQGIQSWLENRPGNPKQIAIVAVLRSYLSPLLLLLGRGPCGDRILRSCLQKGPATALANYAPKSGTPRNSQTWLFQMRSDAERRRKTLKNTNACKRNANANARMPKERKRVLLSETPKRQY